MKTNQETRLQKAKRKFNAARDAYEIYVDEPTIRREHINETRRELLEAQAEFWQNKGYRN